MKRLRRWIVSLFAAEIDEMLYHQSKRASGGPVMAGGTYTVGERGPELLIPPRKLG